MKMEKGGKPDLVVVNYAQVRIHRETLDLPWLAVVLDEAQNIKNPKSLNAKAVCSLNATHRIALTGTPIENRLLDLWSIMAFAMPGALGNRANFSRSFNDKEDPLARRRLSARLRPFLLRRTKKEVASDLPDRVEEDLYCEMEGLQAKLYTAELKKARSMLLDAESSGNFDRSKFSILTSLLRLRQICCHPHLVGHPGIDETKSVKKTKVTQKSTKQVQDDESTPELPETPSSKLTALLELLGPLLEEGHKVLVFSQFVEMLVIIRQEMGLQQWKSFFLT